MQSTYSDAPGQGYLGQLINSAAPRAIRARIARGYVDAGYAVFRAAAAFAGFGTSGTSDPGAIFQRPSPAAAADVDALITSITTSTSVQTLETTDFDGVVGLDEMFPPRRVTLTLSNHADWDATTAVVTGIDADTNLEVTENLSIPDTGNTTLTTTGYFKSVSKLVIPAQSGTGGTATFGIAAMATLTAADFDGVAKRDLVKRTFSADDVANGVATTTADFVDNETVSVVRVGSLWVYAEEAVNEGDSVYVRIASGAGGTHLGAFRNDSDSSTCVQLTNAYFRAKASAAGPVQLTILA